MTLADISLYHIFWFFNKLLPGSVRKYAAIASFYAKMGEEPKLKEWVTSRPKTEA